MAKNALPENSPNGELNIARNGPEPYQKRKKNKRIKPFS